MKTTIAVLAAALLATNSFVAAAALADPSRAAKALDAQSKKSLGVSVRALAFLFDAKPGTYLDKTSLVSSGSWPHIQELERAGYITITIIPSAQGDLVNLGLTKAGSAVCQALCSGPNNSFKPKPLRGSA